jgi:threonine dehydratase
MGDIDVDLGRIEEAARTVDPAFRNSPQFTSAPLCDRLRRQVLVKVETLNPLGSFKGRGADFLLSSLAPHSNVVCASSGNLGMAVAYAGRRHDVRVHVYVPASINPAKLAAMEECGARVSLAGADPAAAARAHAAAHPGHLLIDSHPALAEGAATIGVELLGAGPIDVVVLPVGGGSLVTGVARWVKEKSPHTRVIGVCPVGAPSMAESWRAGHPIRIDPSGTIADGLAMVEPAPEVVFRMRAVVDDIVLVTDTALVAGMRLAAETLGLLIEPSAAAGLAAVIEHDMPQGRVATVLTGVRLSADGPG